MPKHIQVRDVPDEIHAVLSERAAEERLSLSEYLRREMASLAARPSLADVLARAAKRGRGGIAAGQAVALIREDRDSR